MITKMHASITNIHGLVGEKEAASWLKETQKSSTASSLSSKTPVKKPTTAPTKRKTAAAAAAAVTDDSVVNDEVTPNGEKDFLKEVLKPLYIHLLEMDELVREKLFILQVKDLTKFESRRVPKIVARFLGGDCGWLGDGEGG
jgi:hypothetical protein